MPYDDEGNYVPPEYLIAGAIGVEVPGYDPETRQVLDHDGNPISGGTGDGATQAPQSAIDAILDQINA